MGYIQLWEYENVPQQKWIFERAATGVKNNTYYYLKNTYSDKYLDVSNSADTNGTSVRTYTFNGNSNQKWKAVITGNNTYKFVAGSSSTGKVLNVSGSSVNLWTSANATYQYFRLVRDNSISWGGRYYIQYGSKYLVSDIDGQLYFSENKGTHGLWSLEKVTKGTARIYTQSDDIDSTPMDSSFKSNCSAMGYTAYAQHETSRTAPLSHLTSTDIWVHAWHGEPAYLHFKDKTFISAYHIQQQPDSASYAGLRCMITFGCGAAKTGVSGTATGLNIIDEIYDRGAAFAMGFTKEELRVISAIPWERKFFEEAAAGKTILECMIAADSYANNPLVNTGARYYRGDESQRLCR